MQCEISDEELVRNRDSSFSSRSETTEARKWIVPLRLILQIRFVYEMEGIAPIAIKPRFGIA